MKNGPIQLSRRSRRVSIALGYALPRLYRLCYRIQFSGIGVSLIPGLLTCNISFRAGESGRAYHLPLLLQIHPIRYENTEMAMFCTVPLVSPYNIQACAA